MPTDRQNSRLSADVELALALAERAGVRIAARFLAKRGAGFSLICRVLAEPARRRRHGDPVVDHLYHQLIALRGKQVDVHQAAAGAGSTPGPQCDPPPTRTPA